MKDRAEVAFHPPIILFGCIAGGFLARVVLPFPFFTNSFSLEIGVLVAAFSFGLVFWAVYTMRTGGASIPTNKPTEAIVKKGPFRFSRNPIYLSMVTLQFGIAIWSNSLWFVVFAVIFFGLISWGVISREEQYLNKKFGPVYTSYQKQVRRWL